MAAGDWIAVVDTREQQPWGFDRRLKGCAGSEVGTLKTGDYSVKGLEDLLVIERKGKIGEFHQNLFQERERFKNELDRMKGVPFAYVLLEFPLWHLTEYPRVPTVPFSVRNKIKVSGELLLSVFSAMERDYPWVRFHFCGDMGRKMAIAIMRRTVSYAAKSGRTPAGGRET